MIIVTMLVAINAYTQSPSEDRYVLYPTKNIWTFLKLDTSNGKVWQVQYSVEGPDYRFETNLNTTALVLDEDRTSGRFKLYPTENSYNFILIDTKVGTTYQVQWSQESDQRFVVPISYDGQLVWSCGFAKVKFLDSWNYYDENKNYLAADFFDSCEDFNDGLAKVQKDGKCNYIDTKGNYLFKQWYDTCNSIGDDFFQVGSNGKFNIINVDGTIITAESYDYVGYIDSNGLILVEKDGKYNFVNIKTCTLISEWYDDCYRFIDGYGKVVKDKKYNYIGIDGRLLLKSWYDGCHGIYNGFAIVSIEDKYNMIDISTGIPISQEWFDDYKSFNSDGISEVKVGDKWFVIDKTGSMKEK